MDAPIVLKDFRGVIEVTPGAHELKRNALAAARPIRRVETAEQQLTAVAALRQLKEIRTGMEATRKAVKAPVLELGRKIDTAAADFMEDCDKEEGRLSGLINHFQRKQLELKREEDEKINQQAKHAEELVVQAQELRHKAVFEEDLAARTAMVERADAMEGQALDAKLTAEIAVIPEPVKAKGLVVRNRINFQVLDAIVFCQGYPQFWKWNKDTESLKLDRMGILDELNREDGKGLFHHTRFPEELSKTDDTRLVQPAGLRVYEETKAHLR